MDCSIASFFVLFCFKLAMNTNISELQCVATPCWANSTGRGGQFVLCGGARSTCPGNWQQRPRASAPGDALCQWPKAQATTPRMDGDGKVDRQAQWTRGLRRLLLLFQVLNETSATSAPNCPLSSTDTQRSHWAGSACSGARPSTRGPSLSTKERP